MMLSVASQYKKSMSNQMVSERLGQARSLMNTELGLSMDALAHSRPVNGFDAQDRKIIGSVVRALHRLLEHDGITPALQEDQRARVVVHDGKVLLLAAISSQAISADGAASDAMDGPAYRLPPLQTRPQRRFAFG
jgi:hypothetical protein